MRIFLTGVSGLLGSNLAWYFKDRSEVTGTFHTHPVTIPGVETLWLDLEDYPRTREVLKQVAPDFIVHCASRTDVDRQETDKEGSWRSNVLTTRVLLDAARDLACRFVFVSTDSVYPGNRGSYKEGDATDPRNWYGRTKLEAERMVLSHPGSLVLRTNIFGWNVINKESIAEWFLNHLRQGSTVTGFTDAFFSSIYTFNFAELLEQCLLRGVTGLFNLAARDSLSKHAFGQELARIFGLDAGLIQSGTLDQAILPAQRGRNLSLDVGALEAVLQDCRIPTVREGLEAFSRDWQKGVPVQIKQYMKQAVSGCVLPPRGMISYGCQFIDKADLEAVMKVLHSWSLTQGPMIELFEKEVARIVHAQYGVAVSSGTSALHIACLACGVGPGDEVITSPITFVASANCAVYCGATPVFVDIDPRTYNMDPVVLEQKITARTKAVIPVHFAGQSCDMKRIQEIVRQKERLFGHKISIIEDACHALGSYYRDMPVGSLSYSDMTVFSFHPVKHITTAEGGMVVTNDAVVDGRLRMLRSHGISRTSGESGQGPWYYEQVILGFNYRITDLQCALGLSQLKKLDWFRRRRREIVQRYNEAFSGVTWGVTPFEESWNDSNFHLYVFRFDFARIGKSRTEVMGVLKGHGIQTQVHYIPVFSHPFYREHFPVDEARFPHTGQFYESCLSLPLFPGMSDADVETVIREVHALADTMKNRS
ncbi:MAG: UDP-4-amino-4,6-dideoxy-N-acetyl-beta-L-altrosamine transaminase [Magnetococcales bacterium]|nr:UDP-4-amino-4,6-dideoxy-N-acetyl-beta-L-altrosamine transaminase [Magnetococcales bacterium]